MRVVEHTFRPKRPGWLWLTAAVHLAYAAVLGYAFSWLLLIPGALLALLVVVVMRPPEIRLERDERGAAQLVRGKDRLVLDRLVEVEATNAAFRLRCEDGADLLVPLDARLRAEVFDAAGRRRLELAAETETALVAPTA